jgi:hypothetical protein
MLINLPSTRAFCCEGVTRSLPLAVLFRRAPKAWRVARWNMKKARDNIANKFP